MLFFLTENDRDWSRWSRRNSSDGWTRNTGSSSSEIGMSGSNRNSFNGQSFRSGSTNGGGRVDMPDINGLIARLALTPGSQVRLNARGTKSQRRRL